MKSLMLILFISIFIFSCTLPLYKNKNLNNSDNFLINPGPIYDYKSYLKSSIGAGIFSEKSRKVYSIYRGRVYRLSNDPDNITNFGKFVEVRHKKIIQLKNGKKYKVVFISLYANLAEIFVKPNQSVESKTLIGKYGNTMAFRKKEDLFIGIYTFYRSMYMRFLSKEDPIYLLGVYWWNPQKILKL